MIINKVKKYFDRLRYFTLSRKQYNEMLHWRNFIPQCIDWYEGRINKLYRWEKPMEQQKVTGHSLQENALRTWMHMTKLHYPERLDVPSTYFQGMRILDVGCGPVMQALGFTDCEIYGLDDLSNIYWKLGFPVDRYSSRFRYLKGSAENIEVENDYFDAIISVNAIDHVQDFPASAREISRVLRPDGIIRMEVHYHTTTICEPWALNDDLMLKHFGHLGIRKVKEGCLGQYQPKSPRREEPLVVWSNRS